MDYTILDWLLIMIGGSLVSGTLALFGLMSFVFIKTIVEKKPLKLDQKTGNLFKVFSGLVFVDVGAFLLAKHYEPLTPLISFICF